MTQVFVVVLVFRALINSPVCWLWLTELSDALWLVPALAAATQGSQSPTQWQLTQEQRERVQELWAKYGPDYSAYEKVG